MQVTFYYILDLFKFIKSERRNTKLVTNYSEIKNA